MNCPYCQRECSFYQPAQLYTCHQDGHSFVVFFHWEDGITKYLQIGNKTYFDGQVDEILHDKT